MEGAAERYNRLASAGLFMSGHTQRRVIGVSGLPDACFPRAVHVRAYAIDNSPGRTASLIVSFEAGQGVGKQVRCPSTLTATTPAGMISNNFGSYMPRFVSDGFGKWAYRKNRGANDVTEPLRE